MATVVYVSDVAELLHGERVHINLSPPSLVEYAVARGEVRLTANGAVTGYTGEHTGRSPKDRFIVRDEMTRGEPAGRA
jgi:phosphoenolpyruvate carboxykinase (ATP)